MEEYQFQVLQFGLIITTKYLPAPGVFNHVLQNFNRRLHVGSQEESLVSKEVSPLEVEIEIDLLIISIGGLSLGLIIRISFSLRCLKMLGFSMFTYCFISGIPLLYYVTFSKSILGSNFIFFLSGARIVWS